MENSNEPEPKFTQRLLKTFTPEPLPTDDRGRMRMVMDNLVLHLHPAKVPQSTLSWTYTWGLGGLSALLITLLALTGVFLQMNYTPSPLQAYQDVLSLRMDTWFGDLLRNLHHWSANLLVLVSILHLLRVFFTGSYRPPRATNWLVGVTMLILVLGSNFTGYLLPWDQLAFWAITVGTSILSYVPLVGARSKPSNPGRTGSRRSHAAQFLFAAHQFHPPFHHDADVPSLLAGAQGWWVDPAQESGRNRSAKS